MSSTHTSSIHSWYTFDELELRNIREAPLEVTGQNTSTPTRRRNTSHLYTHQSVDPSFREELWRSRYSNISFEEFLKCSFDLSDEDMEDVKKRVEEKSVHTSEGYRSKSKDFADFAEKLEAKMYKPFAEMGNMVLGAHQEGSGNRIKIHPSTGNEYVKGDGFAKRKPDVSIVPEKDGHKEIDSGTLRWYHMLCVLEFKKAHSSRKHPREEEASDLGSRKRSSITFEDPSSAIATSIDGTASGVGPSSRGPGIATRTSTGAKASSARSSSKAGVTTRTSTGAKVSGARSRSSSKTGAVTRTSTANPSGAGSSTSGRTTAAISSTGTSSSQPSGAAQENLPTVRRSQRLAKSSQPGTLPEPMGPPAPVTQVSPSTQPNNQHNNPSTMLCPCAEDRKQAGESPADQVPLDASDSAALVDDIEVQLANYATEMLSVFSDRTFAFGATVKKTKMQLTYYSRSIYVISDEIDIVKDPVMFAVFLCLFSMQPLDKLGFSTDLGYRNPFNTESEQVNNLGCKLDPVNGGDNFILKPDAKVELGELIHTEYCLMGRATTVFDVKRPRDCEIDLVVKVQSQPKTRRREDQAIQIAREVDPEHSPEIYGVAVLDEKSPSEKFKTVCAMAPKQKPEARELRVLLMRKYNPVEELNDDDFCDLVPQFATYVHALYSERELLHRDISIANMAYYVKNGRKIATLIDFDLATFPDQTCEQEGTDPPDATGFVNGSVSPSVVLDTPMVSDAPVAPASLSTAAIVGGKGNNGKCQERSGTTPFMAIETLDLTFRGYVHHLCHELESLFYASVWHGVGYRWSKGIYPRIWDSDRNKYVDLLRGWRVGSWIAVVEKKDAFLANSENILQYMKHPELQDICWNLSILFQQRMSALRGLVRARKVAANSAASTGSLKRQAVKRRAMNFVYNQPIFLTFADIWGFERVECQKSCCVN